MTICCKCHSTELTKLSLVHSEGVSEIQARSQGAGLAVRGFGLGFGYGRVKTNGTLQTRLSELASPPRKKSYWKIILAWFLGLVLAGWVLGYANMLMRNPERTFMQEYRTYAYTYTGALAFLLWSIWRYNHRLFPKRYRTWERSFICRRCGTITQVPEQADLVGRTLSATPRPAEEGR